MEKRLESLKDNILNEYKDFFENKYVGDLKETVQFFEPFLREYYKDLSHYIIERNSLEEGKLVHYNDSLEYFYKRLTKGNKYYNHLIKNTLKIYETENEIFDDIIFDVRGEIAGKFVDNYSTEQYCGFATYYFQKYAKNFPQMKSYIITTSGGYGIPYNPHAFNIVEMNNELYIVDCTYSQFTKLFMMNENILRIPYEVAPEPSFFLLNMPGGLEILNDLFTKGYFKLTPEKLKLYLDSFVLSSRNAYYYLNNNNSNIFDTQINIDYYLKQLNKIIKKSKKLEDDREPVSFYNIYDDKEIPVIYGAISSNDNNCFLTKEELLKLEKKLIR